MCGEFHTKCKVSLKGAANAIGGTTPQVCLHMFIQMLIDLVKGRFLFFFFFFFFFFFNFSRK
jgi:hypothetical protein